MSIILRADGLLGNMSGTVHGGQVNIISPKVDGATFDTAHFGRRALRITRGDYHQPVLIRASPPLEPRREILPLNSVEMGKTNNVKRMRVFSWQGFGQRGTNRSGGAS